MRLMFFVLVGLLGYFAPFWLFVPGVLLYLARYAGYELLLITLLIDAEFGLGGFPEAYRYTLVIGGLVIVSLFIKPHLRFYNS